MRARVGVHAQGKGRAFHSSRQALPPPMIDRASHLIVVVGGADEEAQGRCHDQGPGRKAMRVKVGDAALVDMQLHRCQKFQKLQIVTKRESRTGN